MPNTHRGRPVHSEPDAQRITDRQGYDSARFMLGVLDQSLIRSTTGFDLTDKQAELLLRTYLAYVEGRARTKGTIAKAMGIEHNVTLNKTLTGLIDKQLVETKPSVSDRRAELVLLTAHGYKVCRALLTALVEHMQSLMYELLREPLPSQLVPLVAIHNDAPRHVTAAQVDVELDDIHPAPNNPWSQTDELQIQDGYVALMPSNPFSYLNRARRQLSLGHFDSAKVDIDKALALGGTSAHALMMKALAHVRLQEFAPAFENAVAALASQPDFVQALLVKAECLRGQSLPADAEQIYRRVLELDPNNFWAQKELAELSGDPTQIAKFSRSAPAGGFGRTTRQSKYWIEKM